MSGSRGKIIRGYDSAYAQPLVAAAGEVLTLEDREREWPGWVWGVHPGGRAGWVPEPYLLRSGNRGILQQDYDATELTVAVGQELTVLAEHGCWLRCRTDDGALGWVPAENVERPSGPARVATSSHPHPLPGRQQLRAALLASDEAYRVLVDHAVQGLFIARGYPPEVVFANETLERICGYSPDEFCTLGFEKLSKLVHPEDQEIAFGHYQQRLRGEAAPQRLEYRYIHRDGRVRWVEELVTSITLGGEPATMAAIIDITDRKRAEAERERLITDLKHALAEVKTLRGILPICGHCKKVRDDQGYWKQVELYLHEQTGTEVSHSLCPDCVAELYPDYVARASRDS